jgi:hypothetical protein
LGTAHPKEVIFADWLGFLFLALAHLSVVWPKAFLHLFCDGYRYALKRRMAPAFLSAVESALKTVVGVGFISVLNLSILQHQAHGFSVIRHFNTPFDKASGRSRICHVCVSKHFTHNGVTYFVHLVVHYGFPHVPTPSFPASH